MRKLIGAFFLLIGIIVVGFAVLSGVALTTFGTILFICLCLIGLVFISF